jgi:hypothetical protein
VYGTNHIIEACEVRAKKETKNDGAEEGADETLKGLFWGEFDEGSTADGDAPDICKDIVTDNERCRNPKPYEAFENIIHDKVASDLCMSEDSKGTK